MDDGGSLTQMMAWFPRDTSPVSDLRMWANFLALAIDKTVGFKRVHEQPQNVAFLQYVSACCAAVLPGRRGICPSGPESSVNPRKQTAGYATSLLCIPTGHGKRFEACRALK